MARDFDLVEERALAKAVLERARSDLLGGHVSSSKWRDERLAKRRALMWVHDADIGFRFWCDVAGLEAPAVRQRLLSLVTPDERRELLQAAAVERHRRQLREQEEDLRRRCAEEMRRRNEQREAFDRRRS